MVKINNLEEIDHEKLKALFKRRGRKITIPNFTKMLLEIFETGNKNFEVHQCKCGEVVVVRADFADYLRKQLDTEDIACQDCLGLYDLKIPGQIFVKLKNILELMERCKTDKNQQIILTNEDFEQLKKEGRGLFATNSVDEFYFGLDNFSTAFFNEFQEKGNSDIYAFISEIFESAIKINQNVIEEFQKTQNANAFDAASLNTYLTFKTGMDLLSKISDEKFLKSEISEFHSSKSITAQSKPDIKLKMAGYKDLVEEHGHHLDILLNLINVIEGRKVVSNPFNKLKLPPKRKGDKERKIRGLQDKIELFKYHYCGDKMYPLLSDIFDTKLRNDEAHNQYEIDIERKIIKSTKYNKETSFEDLDEKISKLSSFYSFLNEVSVNRHSEKIKPLMKNKGIELVLTGYTDPILICDKLFPNNHCMPELSIYQYWDFAQYENGKRWIPIPELSFNNNLKISFKNGNTFDQELNYDVELWLDQLILHEAYTLSLYTIAPPLPSFNQKSIMKIPVGNLPEINILALDEKIIKLPENLIKDLREMLNL